MTSAPRFALVPLARLKSHERIEPHQVDALVDELRESGVFVDPIWLARGSDVILNGHHRVAALRRLGAVRVPAWVFDYDDDRIALDRWTAGPPLTKEEVVRRAHAGKLYPPKTTRHRLALALRPHPTPLALLFDGPRGQSRAPRPSRSRAAGASGPG
jgi:L-serine kinase (ADP)